jgi:hypothetical protein
MTQTISQLSFDKNGIYKSINHKTEKTEDYQVKESNDSHQRQQKVERRGTSKSALVLTQRNLYIHLTKND